MQTDTFTKVMLVIIALLLALNLIGDGLSTRTAKAENSEVGRYQISAWSAQSGSYTHHSGYYILDTITGKVIASKSEVHTSGR
ncbi:MAG: hypothetical protein D6726_03335 [Nitrospirae bacterium]|nr:MAG: hypothetical protein D6726_03335 [Nitrospirota bacterium]